MGLTIVNGISANIDNWSTMAGVLHQLRRFDYIRALFELECDYVLD
jgi:hypothetical protein